MGGSVQQATWRDHSAVRLGRRSRASATRQQNTSSSHARAMRTYRAVGLGLLVASKAPDEQIPTIAQLCDDYGVAKVTALKALSAPRRGT